MKREEAVRIIKECKKKGFKHTFYTLNEYHTALDIAIKALEQEPTEFEEIDFVQEHKKIPVALDLTPCDDAISRQAAIEAFQMFREYESNRSNKEWVDRIETVLNQLPPVTSQTKTGHWIRMSDLSEQEDDRYKCSHCGNVIHHKNKMNLYTFNSWCGRCGSNNRK